jgi:hypothetical protein
MDDTVLRFLCPGCGKRLKAPESAPGRTVKCPTCGTALVVPETPSRAAAQDSESSGDYVAPDDMDLGVNDEHAKYDVRLSVFGRIWYAVDLIFDFRFRRYLTPCIVRVLWVIVLLLTALYFFHDTFISPFADTVEPSTGFRPWTAPSQPRVVAEPSKLSKAALEIMNWILQSAFRSVACITSLMFVRVLGELAIVVFNISNDLKSSKKETTAAP